MDKCDGITRTTITQKMMDDYPELAEKGLKVGDKLTTSEPFDGVINGAARSAGECEKVCHIVRPEIDGNKPDWESEFVQKFLPYELGKLEGIQKNPQASKCYADDLMYFASKQISRAAPSEKFSREEYERLDRLAFGTPTSEDMKWAENVLTSAIEKIQSNGENPTSMKTALAVVKNAQEVSGSKPSEE